MKIPPPSHPPSLPHPPPPLHLYLHIPFCQRICAYCDFARVAGNAHWYVRYIAALLAELNFSLPLLPTHRIATVYIGGGSPSCLPVNLLTQLLANISSHLELLPGAEITVEANPHHVTFDWARTLLDAGVNRFSLGVQSLHDGELRILHRLHTAADARRAFSVLRSAACNNISVDLMYGLPNQSDQSWHATVTEIAREWQPEHLSLYALHLEDKTPLARIHLHSPALYSWPDDDRIMNWYWYAIDAFAARHYVHYELSNAARNGFASRHNLAYWDTHQHYLGLGAAAHSYCRLTPWSSPRRFRNLRNFRTYCTRLESQHTWRIVSRPLPRRARLGEEIFLALRRTNGFFPRPELLAAFGTVIQNHLDTGCLHQLPNGAIALTRRGMEIANTVMADFTCPS